MLSATQRRRKLEFLKPAAKLRELWLLSTMADSPQISQRKLSQHAGVSVSVVNGYLARFVDGDLVRAEALDGRNVRYSLTPRGEARLAELTVEYLREAFVLFSQAKEELSRYLEVLQSKHKINRAVLYPAGEVAELVIHALPSTSFKLVALVDDSPQKQGQTLLGFPVISLQEVAKLKVDTIIIATYRYRRAVMAKAACLQELGIKVVPL